MLRMLHSSRCWAVLGLALCAACATAPLPPLELPPPVVRPAPPPIMVAAQVLSWDSLATPLPLELREGYVPVRVQLSGGAPGDTLTALLQAPDGERGRPVTLALMAHFLGEHLPDAIRYTTIHRGLPLALDILTLGVLELFAFRREHHVSASHTHPTVDRSGQGARWRCPAPPGSAPGRAC